MAGDVNKADTVNLSLGDPHLMHLTDEHHWQRYELYRRHEHSFPSPILLSSDEGDLIDELRSLTEHRLPELSVLDGETMEMTRGE